MSLRLNLFLRLRGGAGREHPAGKVRYPAVGAEHGRDERPVAALRAGGPVRPVDGRLPRRRQGKVSGRHHI